MEVISSKYTSQDPFTIRKPNNQHIPFTLVIVGNNPPLFPIDEAIKRRICIYEFSSSIWEENEII